MGRISQHIHANLWGRTFGLEPQRNDLWFVDFTEPLKSIKEAFAGRSVSALPAILPQFVRSIKLPEYKVRAETVRRCSVPYQMPSWDEPLEILQIQFLLVQAPNEAENESPVLVFLNQWLQLVRTGRGLRISGGPDYHEEEGPPLLENAEGGLAIPKYAHSFELVLLKGAMPTRYKTRDEQLQARYALLAAKRKAIDEAADSLKHSQTSPPPRSAPPDSSTSLASMTVVGGEIEVATRIKVRQAWLANYRVSDLSYEGTAGLAVVDAGFYAESLQFGGTSQ